MAVKYLAGDRLIGTAAERAALTVAINTSWEDTAFSSNWSTSSGDDASVTGATIRVAPATNDYALMTFDLQSANGINATIDSDTWVFQFDIDQTTWSVNSASTYLDGVVMLSSVAGRSGDHVIFGAVNTNPKNGYRFAIVNGSGHDGMQEGGTAGTRNYQPSGAYTPSTTQGINSNGKLGVRITRTSSTTFKYEICTDPTFAAGTTTTYNSSDTTAAAAITSLRYIQIGGYIGHSGGIDGTNVVDVDNMKFWNGEVATTTYPKLPNGAIFEQTDDGKHYMFDGTSAWNEM